MTPFADIEAVAAERSGGAAELETRLPQVRSPAELAAVPDDRYLSDMSRRIFQAGIRHSVVDAKWPAFEDVFLGFEPRRLRSLPDEALEALMGEERIIRHWGKIRSVRHNAAALCELSDAHGGFGAWLGQWPAGDTVGLWEALSKHFAQLGGNSGAYFLRSVGRDSFILTDFVVKALNRWDAFPGTPKGKKDRQAVQQAFNAWSAESGRPQAQISRILAISVD